MITSWKVCGGPYDCEVLALASPSTLIFTAKGMKGRYRAGVKAIHSLTLEEVISFPEEPYGVNFDSRLHWETIK